MGEGEERRKEVGRGEWGRERWVVRKGRERWKEAGRGDGDRK